MTDICRNCPICDLPTAVGDSIAEFGVNHHNKENLHRKRYELSYCQCGDLIYLSPIPSPQDIQAMYAHTRQFGDSDSINCVYRGDHAVAVLEYIAGCLVAMMKAMALSLADSIRVLEVGAGLSWMCRAAKIVDWQNLTVAQDLSSEAVTESRWVDHYIVEDLLTDSGVNHYAPFDVISLTHVFEHLADPVGMLRRLKGLLSQRGFVFITAPHRPEGWRRGADAQIWWEWSYNHVPAHIQYFSRQSFEKAAKASGLEVARWSHSHENGQAFEGWLRHES